MRHKCAGVLGIAQSYYSSTWSRNSRCNVYILRSICACTCLQTCQYTGLPSLLGSGCANLENEDLCAYWGSFGYCTIPSFSEFMSAYCERTCTGCFNIRLEADSTSLRIFPPDRVPPLPSADGKDSAVRSVRKHIAAAAARAANHDSTTAATAASASPSVVGSESWPSTAALALAAAGLAIVSVFAMAAQRLRRRQRQRVVPSRGAMRPGRLWPDGLLPGGSRQSSRCHGNEQESAKCGVAAWSDYRPKQAWLDESWAPTHASNGKSR